MLTVCGLLLLVTTSVRSQTSAQIVMADGNPQRSRVFATKSVDKPPQQLLWQSEKLFELKHQVPISVKAPGETIRGYIPTHHSLTFPIVSEGIIFFTLYVGNAYLYAIDANTGKRVVTLKFKDNKLSAPAVMGKVAFFGTSTNRVYAFDVSTRSYKWTYEGKGSFSSSPPVIEDGVVYIAGSEDGIVALDADTGTLKWTIKARQVLDRPAIKGDHVIVYGVNGVLFSVNKKTGAKNWETNIGPEIIGTAILDDQVFVSDRYGEIRAYSIADGSLRWTSKKDGGAHTTLTLFKEAVIYGEEFGNIVALDARSGKQKWKFKTKEFCLGPVIAGETAYTTCADHHLYAIDPHNGQPKWAFDWKKTDGPMPAFADGVMYFLGSDGILVATK